MAARASGRRARAPRPVLCVQVDKLVPFEDEIETGVFTCHSGALYTMGDTHGDMETPLFSLEKIG